MKTRIRRVGTDTETEQREDSQMEIKRPLGFGLGAENIKSHKLLCFSILAKAFEKA